MWTMFKKHRTDRSAKVERRLDRIIEVCEVWAAGLRAGPAKESPEAQRQLATMRTTIRLGVESLRVHLGGSGCTASDAASLSAQIESLTRRLDGSWRQGELDHFADVEQREEFERIKGGLRAVARYFQESARSAQSQRSAAAG